MEPSSSGRASRSVAPRRSPGRQAGSGTPKCRRWARRWPTTGTAGTSRAGDAGTAAREVTPARAAGRPADRPAGFGDRAAGSPRPGRPSATRRGVPSGFVQDNSALFAARRACVVCTRSTPTTREADPGAARRDLRRRRRHPRGSPTSAVGGDAPEPATPAAALDPARLRPRLLRAERRGRCSRTKCRTTNHRRRSSACAGRPAIGIDWPPRLRRSLPIRTGRADLADTGRPAPAYRADCRGAIFHRWG